MGFGTRQQKSFNKFLVMSQWMCNDIYRSIFDAKANFLVAMGLFNYIEVIGSFVIGPFEKDTLGEYKRDRRGKKIETKNKERFESFIKRMGSQYLQLYNNHQELYSDLRCGLTHEYLIKRKAFCVYGCDERYSETEMDQLKNPVNPNEIANCGIIYERISRNMAKWHILNAKLYVDFKRAIEEFSQEIQLGSDRNLKKLFFERCKNINMVNF